MPKPPLKIIPRIRYPVAPPRRSTPRIVRLWLLRWMDTFDLTPRFVQRARYTPVEIFRNVGIPFDEDGELPPLDTLRERVRSARIAAESAAADTRPPRRIASRIAMFADLYGLSDVEARLLTFVTLAHRDGALVNCMDMMGLMHETDLVRVISVALSMNPRTIDAALQPERILVASAFVILDKDVMPMTVKLRAGPLAE